MVCDTSLGGCPFRSITGIGMSLLFVFSSLRSCEVLGLAWLGATIRNTETVGPSQVEPLYGEIFAARYGPPFRVQVWCPDALTSYVVQVPKMVCFFEVAFDCL